MPVRLPPGRWRILVVLLVAFVLFNALVRLGLALFNAYGAEGGTLNPLRLVPAMGIGALFDIGVASFFLAPIGVLVLAWRQGPGRWLKRVLLGLLLPLCVVMVFVAFSEFTFWNEFASRFNFIAVDYLIYTNEVVGNIRESYNLPLLLGGVAVVSLLVWALVARALRPHWASVQGQGGWGRRLAGMALLCGLPVLAVLGLDARYKEFSSDAQANELAGNGYYDFWHAFWTNEIDYGRFYKTLPRDQALRILARELPQGQVAAGQVASATDRPLERPLDRPFDRQINNPGPAKRLNVVMISVESFSAEFMTAFGNRQGLTPRLDKLAEQGLLFTQLYATGTRTVRGLEALSLSVPPTPGHSIVKRPNNDGLLTVGEVFKAQGYEPLYLYGGYGYFDNMNAFYAGNGYTVIDRTALAKGEIHFENIWGVADEDLFTLSLRSLDQRHAAGKPFYAHIMTTTNHRPFTYPAGRIDIPSKTGREGGVKYTDWAIGDFLERARAKPWFANTLFVIVADHTHKGRGRQELPIDNYHIPMIVYAPGHVAPGRVDTIASQIDVSPTVLGLLGMSYRSHFFGQDILREGRTHQRALMANYQTVGYYERGRTVELKPNARVRVVDASTGKPAPDDELSRQLTEEAIAYYQIAADAYKRGELKRPAAATKP